MRYTRTGIIVALVGAEIFIAGAILALLGGHHGWAVAAATANAAPLRTIEAFDAGSAPRIQIDDADSRVTVSVSTDGRVHVADESRYGGMRWGDSPPGLTAERTGDGVRIFRPSAGQWSMFGWEDRRISVQVPAGAAVEIAHCAGADVSGLSGAVSVVSDDGDIAARDITGNVQLQTADGHVEVQNVRAERLEVASDDGHLTLRDVAVQTLQATTKDGSIEATGLRANGGEIRTDDGGVNLAFDAVNLSIQARTDDGNVTFDGRNTDSGNADSSSGFFHVGSGGGQLLVSSGDGDIHILTNGAS
ncbi:MAG TPA: DUF4097 family beta strand repeat-containing protein [Candidatus Baltobacteraceae bacterium]|nr:DUF4097 family beta strand repeat-containing protein [Candidatus Baltobacteraceae bacterium]